MAKKTVVFDEYKSRKMETSAIVIEIDSEHVYTIPPVELWSPELMQASIDNDSTLLVNLLTDNAADLLATDYGCSATTFLAMIFEGMGHDVGKALESVLSSENTN